MPLRAIALLSGGLDSMLAIRILQLQGVYVEALNFRTQFACCRETAARAARLLDVPLTVLAEQDDYLDVVRRPKFGYGRGANPCVDCRIYMFQRARAHLEATGADFVVSGEVLGQRPMSQKRRDLLIIERHSGLDGRLLRPLSAKRLPPTLAEQTGAIDRARLFDFSGRSRKGLIELARQFGFPEQEIPGPSTGCMLTQQRFAPRVYDLIYQKPDNTRWDFELLKIGRHLRYNERAKVVVGRRETENLQLQRIAEEGCVRDALCLVPHNFSGPTALIVGRASPEAVDFAGGLILRFCHFDDAEVPLVRVAGEVREARRTADAEAAAML
jgi:tRNA U34 2-thiouridine synthase MnmA/TrmU